MKVFKKLAVTVLTLSILIANMQVGNGKVTQAATSSKNLAAQYLNAVDKYLHLGEKSQNSFDFNIKSSAKDKKAKYVWAINKQKGKPDAVSINNKTGVVTAKKIGTAYIYCKITKANGTVLKPETSVIVRNNVKEINISDVSNHQTVAVDSELNFGYQVINTEASAKTATSDIIKWELQADTAGTTVSSKGVTKSSKEGTFQIRAVSFQGSNEYSKWLKNKSANEKYITASSQWYTIFVEKNLKEAVVTNQAELEAALNDKNITLISIQTNDAIKFSVPKGDYSNKSISVNAPNADVDNEGTFKHVVIQAIKDTTWIEFGKGNSIYTDDSHARIVIAKDSNIKEIVIGSPNSIVNIVADGNINMVTLLQPAQVSFSGTSSNVPVVVESAAAGSSLSSSIPLNLNMMADTSVDLNKGAEGTVLNRVDNTVEVSVTNDTKKEVQLLTNNVGEQVVAPGTSAVSNVETGKKPTTKPTITPVITPANPTEAPNGGGSGGSSGGGPGGGGPGGGGPIDTPAPSGDAQLKSFTIGNDSVLTLAGLEVTNPSLDIGANKDVHVNDVFEGITVIQKDSNASVQVIINNVTIDKSLFAKYKLLPKNIIVIKVTAQNGTIKYYKVTLRLINSNPIAIDDSDTMDEDDNSRLIDVIKNDKDENMDVLTIRSYTQSVNGGLVEQVGSLLKYTPKKDFNGEDSFSYTVSDGKGGTSTATVTVTVRAVNDIPFGTEDKYSLKPNTSIDITNVLDNDIDIDTPKNALTARLKQGPQYGTIEEYNKTCFRYTPNPNYEGNDSFTYIINDGEYDSEPVTVSITIINVPFEAVDDRYGTLEDTPVTIKVLNNDYKNGGVINSISVSDAKYGTLKVNDDMTVLYTPKPNSNYTDTFEYTVTYNGDQKSTAKVVVSFTPVNDAPVAVDNTYEIDEDAGAVTLDALSNDEDIDGTNMTIYDFTKPELGQLTVDFGSKNFIYKPKDNVSGVDTFKYRLRDADKAISDYATVTITIRSIDDIPKIIDDHFDLTEDKSETLDVLANDSDVEGDSFSLVSCTNGTKGTTKIIDNKILYTPYEDAFGGDSFSYTVVYDKDKSLITANVDLSIKQVDDAPIAVPDDLYTDEDTPITFDLRGNDVCKDKCWLDFALDQLPSHGKVYCSYSEGIIKYTPDLNYNGTDSFKYHVINYSGDKLSSNVADVSITIKPVTDPYKAIDDSITVDNNSSGSYDILSNDQNIDNLKFTLLSVGACSNGGTASINKTDNTIIYTPQKDYIGMDSFTYLVRDENGKESTATVTVTIKLGKPVVNPDSDITLNEDTSILIDVLKNDVNAGPNPTIYISNLHNGTAIVEKTPEGYQMIRYTPNPDYNGIDTFTYGINNGVQGSNLETVTLNIDSIYDNPLAVDDVVVMYSDESIFPNYLANDKLEKGDSFTCTFDYDTKKLNLNKNGGTINISSINHQTVGITYITYTLTVVGKPEIPTTSAKIKVCIVPKTESFTLCPYYSDSEKESRGQKYEVYADGHCKFTTSSLTNDQGILYIYDSNGRLIGNSTDSVNPSLELDLKEGIYYLYARIHRSNVDFDYSVNVTFTKK